MATTYAQTTVTSVATSILAAADSRRRLIFRNTGAVIIYIGEDNTVTTTKGYPIGVGQTFYLHDYKGAVYGIVASTSGTLSVIEERI